MAAEHGYQRSGKKCREKLENLYKYYKKTKEGKAGRQDGKHYRFFRQLEALYGENSNAGTIETNPVENKPFLQIANPSTSQANQETLHVQKISESLSLSNSSNSNASSSSDDEDFSAIAFTETDTFNKRKDTGKLKRGRKGWKAKIREFVDLQMKRFMDIQEAWLERMLKTLEHHEQERLAREEAWRKQESERFNHEHRIWANERAWIEARSTALIEALNKFNRPEMKASLSPQELPPVHIHEDGQDEMENRRETFGSSLGNKRCSELEILYLIQIRAAMETEFKETGCFNLALWQEVAGKMGCLGYDIDAKQCKEKWENINGHLKIKNKDCNKKRKENSKTCPYFHHLDSPYNMQEGGGISSQGTNEHVLETAADRPDHQGPSPSNSNAGAIGNYSCLRFLMADSDQNSWENYAVKLNKEESQ